MQTRTPQFSQFTQFTGSLARPGRLKAVLPARMVTALACALLACVVFMADARPVQAFLNPTMDISDFRFRCRFADDDSQRSSFGAAGCDFSFQARVCDRYTEALKRPYPNRTACIAACDEVKSEAFIGASAFGCRGFRRRANTICEQYCRINYGQ